MKNMRELLSLHICMLKQLLYYLPTMKEQTQYYFVIEELEQVRVALLNPSGSTVSRSILDSVKEDTVILELWIVSIQNGCAYLSQLKSHPSSPVGLYHCYLDRLPEYISLMQSIIGGQSGWTQDHNSLSRFEELATEL